MFEESLQHVIPTDQLRVQGPSIDRVYLDILGDLTQSSLSAVAVTDTRYEQGDLLERTARYGDERSGLVMSAEPIQSGYGIHGETATWQFIGLPHDLELVGYSRLDYRGIGKQSIELLFKTADPQLRDQVKQAFTKAIVKLTA